eukprot:5803036-Prymnesium_polylepis.1
MTGAVLPRSARAGTLQQWTTIRPRLCQHHAHTPHQAARTAWRSISSRLPPRTVVTASWPTGVARYRGRVGCSQQTSIQPQPPTMGAARL